MQYILRAPESVHCTINLPASKSISNRALVINALAQDFDGVVPPENLSHCDDTDVMVAALQKMPYVINIKAAGTAMRFMTAFLSSRNGEHILTGTERMTQRPIHVLVDALRVLGAEIDYVTNEGYPPLRVRGKKMSGGEIEIAGNVSSQYISALLMIGPVMENGLTLHLTGNIISRPYIDLTICTMKEFGAEVEWEDGNTIVVKAKPYESRKFTIENDWSASSYWYEIMALMGSSQLNPQLSTLNSQPNSVILPGLMDASRQGDSAVRYIYSMLGVKTEFAEKTQLKPNTVTLSCHHRGLPHFDFDFINQPDLAQTVVVTTALLGIPFRFTGLQTLRIKETDRITALKTEMAKLGYELDDSEEGVLSWDGKRKEVDIEKVVIDTYEDHRMAMAFAPACIMFPGLKINNPEVVTKSYPHYWDDLKKAGFEIVNSL
ncbi:MAG: 3-phosphoshikimate 1-carboxyvinyltransferase [Prevotella sp.]|nr:3-phosphoshikimate 1-carboxyvinyltransferase [Prevotella sp.]